MIAIIKQTGEYETITMAIMRSLCPHSSHADIADELLLHEVAYFRGRATQVVNPMAFQYLG